VKVAIVTGSRDWENRTAIWSALDQEHPDIVVHGSCEFVDKKTQSRTLRGADRFADEWARKHGVMLATMPALFGSPLKERAGPIRNSFMVRLVHAVLCGWPNQPHQVVVIAAPSPDGSGTQDLVAKAQKHLWRIREVVPYG
jgi:hypothetical protein